ncbi:phenylalanine transporter [Salmonella enterica subsp. enterica serovar Newport]|uniref:phenylalanine transporter n=2 Tax=Salmonella enterica TaxID=28901 RepID=UPI000D57D5FA|nr:phenylalanine transporter [Salmonella enterica]EII1418641.1 phenylalanine transporter [Salmonella enterica subsp. enterica serovar Newport]PVJ05952.1 phenylalanine transporter [Salmonella enterica subsp. enterica serovar Newport]PVP82540.1 phenylalanine transporter [Salmonella enterica subsp. enterica serovar Newport]
MKNASTASGASVSDAASKNEPTLQRGLQNRHIQLIALGGAIGTGLFLGIGPAIQMAGPAVLLGYGVAGIIAFLIMRQLGEMVVEEPVSGSFAHFAWKYWGPFAGFLSGWNYWVMFVLVGMAELTAAGIYMQYWLPDVPTWVWAAAFFIIINAVNLVNVRLYGETEFWFALIKVLAIIGMIGFGLWLLFSGHGGEHASIDNLWRYNGFFATGWHGLLLSLAVIMFSFGGLELIGITAAEARDPQKSIPKAVNQVVYRILLFYIGSLVVLLALYPWVEVKSNSSPFVMIFHNLDSNVVASALNFVILVASLSVYNSGVYSNSRMLFGLSVQGNAPKFLTRVSHRGVPVNSLMLSGAITSLMLSGAITSLVVLINYLLPQKAFSLLMALVVATLLLNWIMICLAHLRFRAAMRRKGRETQFKALFYPAGNYLCIAFLALILVLMCTMDDMRLSAILLPVWIVFLFIAFTVLRRKAH